MNHPGTWTMIAQRRGTHHLAHIVDPALLGYGSVQTKCLKFGRVILPLGALDSSVAVCKTCLKRAK